MSAICVLEKNLTFFECLGRVLDIRARSIHDHLLLYFVQNVFYNAQHFTTLHAFCEYAKKHASVLQLSPRCATFAPVKEWIERFHAVEELLPLTADVWFISYPKLLKSTLLRFIFYHRNYAKKPHRLYCAAVFAHLAADLYGCVVGIQRKETGQIRWFYPLDSEDYFLMDSDSDWVKSVTVRVHARGCSLLKVDTVQLPPAGSPLMLQLEKDDDTTRGAGHAFMLRLAQPGKNTPLAHFAETTTLGVYCCSYDAPIESIEKDIYQVYPGNANRTFFDLAVGEQMAIYCMVKEARVLCVVHHLNDQYPYFYAPPGTEAFVVVVARSTSQCDQMIQEYFDGKINQ